MTLNLVTGGSGFVGKHLVKQLLDRGEQVRVLDLDPSPFDNSAVETIKGSILNTEDVHKACENVDTIFHLASNAQLWAKNEKIFDEVNHLGTRRLLESAKGAKVQRFVHCSSLTTLVDRTSPIGKSNADERVELEPENCIGAYPQSKRRAELVVLEAKAYMDVVIAMPTEPLGAGDENITPPTQMILDFVNDKTPAYIDCILNFVPVTSLAHGFIAARDRGINGERYLLGGENITMHDLLSRLTTKTGKKMPTLKMPYTIAHMAGFIDTKIIATITGKPPKAPLTGVQLAGRQIEFSSHKALEYLDWKATDINVALQEMLDWATQVGLLKPNH